MRIKLLTILLCLIPLQAQAFGLWGSADMFGVGGVSVQSTAVFPLTSSLTASKGGPLTFTRASAVWSPNASGILTSYATDVPAFDLVGGKGILSEPAATNLLTYSKDYSNAAWVKSNVAVVASNIADPAGGNTATELSFEAVGGSIFRSVRPATTASAPYSASVWMRAKTGTFALKIARTNGSNWTGSTVTNEIVLTTTWQRYDLPFVTDAGSTISDFSIGSEGKTPYNLPATGNIYIFESQMEAGFSTSIIHTTTAATTRAATILSEPAADLPAGTKHIQLKWTPTGYAAGATQYLWSTYVDANNHTNIQFNGSTSLILRKKIAGVNYDATLIIVSPTLNTQYLIDGWLYADGTTKIQMLGTSAMSSDTLPAQIGSTLQIGSQNGMSQMQGFVSGYKILKR